MRLLFKHIVLFLIFTTVFQVASCQKNSIKGYKIRGSKLTFIFNVNDYPNILNNGEPIKEVFVSGEFNNWATNQWKMKRTTDSTYELTKELSDFTSDFDWEFKYVVNKKHWAEPTPKFKNSVEARNKYGQKLMAYNLKLYSAFATDYGNVSFNLRGYKNAKKVILSGTFNRWDESGFKMKPTKNGWNVTLQLRPDVYEYKFIIDGNWIIDPQNPSKVRNEFFGFNSVINIKRQTVFKLCDFLDAKTVILASDFNRWSEDKVKMKKDNNCWVYSTALSGGKYHYKFIVDGKWIIDPTNSVVEYDGDGNINSVCIVK